MEEIGSSAPSAAFLPVLMYHEIGDADHYGFSASALEEHLRLLREQGFESIVPEELGRPALPGKPVMITFDDGFETDRTRALALLSRYGYRAVSFITTGFIGKRRYMNWQQVRELRDAGWSVQSHTHSHPFLNTESAESVRTELRISKHLIEGKLGTEVTCLALPGGGFPKKIDAIAIGEGYRRVFSSQPVRNRLIEPPVVLGRMRAAREMTQETFRRIVEMDRTLYRRHAARYRLRQLLKSLIGYHTYHRLWTRFYKYR